MIAPPSSTIDELYTTQIRPLPLADRLRLLALLAQDVAGIVQAEAEEPEKMTVDEHIAQANYTGGGLFKTAEEVDAYIRKERDSWER